MQWSLFFTHTLTKTAQSTSRAFRFYRYLNYEHNIRFLQLSVLTYRLSILYILYCGSFAEVFTINPMLYFARKLSTLIVVSKRLKRRTRVVENNWLLVGSGQKQSRLWVKRQIKILTGNQAARTIDSRLRINPVILD